MSQVNFQMNVYAGQRVLLQTQGVEEHPLRNQLWQTLKNTSHWTRGELINTQTKQVVLSLRKWA